MSGESPPFFTHPSEGDGQREKASLNDPLFNDIPKEFGALRSNIKAQLLRVHSSWLEDRDLNKGLRQSYDVFANAYLSAGTTLTEVILTESIPGLVFQWAVAQKWMSARPRQRSKTPHYTYSGREYYSPDESVPESELTAALGPFRVTDWYKDDVLNRILSRLVYWQAEAITRPQPILSVQSDPANLLLMNPPSIHIGAPGLIQDNNSAQMEPTAAGKIPDITDGLPPPVRTKRKPHPDPEAILAGKKRVTYQTAALLLGVSERRVRQLVSDGTLEATGKGNAKQITTASIRRRLDLSTISEESGNTRK